MEEKKKVDNESAGIVSFKSNLIPSPRLIDNRKCLIKSKV